MWAYAQSPTSAPVQKPLDRDPPPHSGGLTVQCHLQV